MKKNVMIQGLRTLAVASGMVLLGAGPAWSLAPETAMLLDLLKGKGVISASEAAEFTRTLETKSATAAPAADDHYHSVQSLKDRVERLEGKGGDGLAEIVNKIDLSGLVEVDLSSARTKDAEGYKLNSSNITLATAQVNADAAANQYVNAHLALLYEEDPDDSSNNNIALDEAIIGLKGGESWPAYANLGHLYVPFGNFESHFISDPQTLILGETNDTAVIAGYANDIMDVNVGVFRGKAKETGKDDHISSGVASAKFSWPKGGSEKGLAMTGGVSYLSNLAASDGLVADQQDKENEGLITATGEIDHVVGGASAFLGLAYADRYFFDAEYLSALGSFADGDFSFVDDHNRRPQAWNVEVAARFVDKLEFALRYGGSIDAGTFLAEEEYGVALLYDIFDNTALIVEYLVQDFQDGSSNSQVTTQLAVEF